MCDNQVSYFVASGFTHKEVFIKCGYTDIYGGRAQCDDCQASAAKREENRRILDNARADNDWLHSAGYGEI